MKAGLPFSGTMSELEALRSRRTYLLTKERRCRVFLRTARQDGAVTNCLPASNEPLLSKNERLRKHLQLSQINQDTLTQVICNMLGSVNQNRESVAQWIEGKGV